MDRQTDRRRRIRAHRALAQVGSKSDQSWNVMINHYLREVSSVYDFLSCLNCKKILLFSVQVIGAHVPNILHYLTTNYWSQDCSRSRNRSRSHWNLKVAGVGIGVNLFLETGVGVGIGVRRLAWSLSWSQELPEPPIFVKGTCVCTMLFGDIWGHLVIFV